MLTNEVWNNSPQHFTPTNLRPKEEPTAANLEHFAMPMIHPTTGETISSYKKLMNDPTTMEIWQTAFGKDFGGMAQGDNKTGQKGTNAIFVMTHADIPLIPADRTITYARVVVDFRPQKADPHRIRITAEETVNFKRSKFFVAKSDMPKDMCEFMQQEKTQIQRITGNFLWYGHGVDGTILTPLSAFGAKAIHGRHSTHGRRFQ